MPYFLVCTCQKSWSLVNLGLSSSISSQYFTFVSAEISALLLAVPGFFLLAPDDLACGDCWGSLFTSLAVFLAISMSSASLSAFWAFSSAFSLSNSFLSLMASCWNLLSLCLFSGCSDSETGFSAPLFWLPVPKNLPRPDCTLSELGGEDWGLPVESFWGVDSAPPPLTLSCFFTLVEYNVDANHQQNVLKLKPNFKTAENLQ